MDPLDQNREPFPAPSYPFWRTVGAPCPTEPSLRAGLASLLLMRCSRPWALPLSALGCCSGNWWPSWILPLFLTWSCCHSNCGGWG